MGERCRRAGCRGAGGAGDGGTKGGAGEAGGRARRLGGELSLEVRHPLPQLQQLARRALADVVPGRLGVRELRGRLPLYPGAPNLCLVAALALCVEAGLELSDLRTRGQGTGAGTKACEEAAGGDFAGGGGVARSDGECRKKLPGKDVQRLASFWSILLASIAAVAALSCPTCLRCAVFLGIESR